MTRYFPVTDLDGRNSRLLTMEEWEEATDRGDPIRLDLPECHDNVAPRDLEEAFNNTFGKV